MSFGVCVTSNPSPLISIICLFVYFSRHSTFCGYTSVSRLAAFSLQTFLTKCNSFLKLLTPSHICASACSLWIHLPYHLSTLACFIVLIFSSVPHHLLPFSLCRARSASVSCSLSSSLSSTYVFALAQLSAARSSCTHTHVRTHTYTSVYMPMTVRRSR